MRPICCALDILQGDKEVGLVYLLPTLSILKQQLTELQQRSENHLTLCGPLVVALKDGVSKRFELLLSPMPNCQQLPLLDLNLTERPMMFKSHHWLNSWRDVFELLATAQQQLKRRVRALGNSTAAAEETCSSCWQQHSSSWRDVFELLATAQQQLKRRVRALGDSTTDQTSELSVTEDTDAADFFARISAARKQRIESTEDDAGLEVERYLSDLSP